MLIDALISLLILIGAGFVLIGAIGLVRLPDFFARLHAPTKATTLGVGGVLLASILHSITVEGRLSLHELLGSVDIKSQYAILHNRVEGIGSRLGSQFADESSLQPIRCCPRRIMHREA